MIMWKKWLSFLFRDVLRLEEKKMQIKKTILVVGKDQRI